MTVPERDVIAFLCSDVSDDILRGLKTLKNQIIGNHHKKLAFIRQNAVQLVVDKLKEHWACELVVQGCGVLGSFAYGFEEGAQAVCSTDALSLLYKSLNDSSEQVVRAGVRALKILLQAANTPAAESLSSTTLQHLICLTHQSNDVAENAARVLAHCCCTSHKAQELYESNALNGLLVLLKSQRLSAKEAAIEALSALTEHSSAACTDMLCDSDAISQVFLLLKSPHARVQFLAGSCFANITSCMPDDAMSEQSKADMQKAALMAMIKLLSHADLQQLLSPAIARLIASSEQLQQLATDMEAVRQLMPLMQLQHAAPACTAGTLKCISTLCLSIADNRKHLADKACIAAIARHLQSRDVEVQEAAALCVRAIGRGLAEALDTTKMIHEAGIAAPLLNLMSSPNTDVQCASCLAVGNLVLVPSDVRQELLKLGVIPKIVAAINSSEVVLQRAGVMALHNLIYEADAAVRHEVMGVLTWPHMRALLSCCSGAPHDSDDDSLLQLTAAFTVMRNIWTPLKDQQQEAYSKGLLAWCNYAELLHCICDKLRLSSALDAKVAVEVLYTLSNAVAVGPPDMLEMVMRLNIPDLLKDFLMYQSVSDESLNARVRIPALWVIINLTYEPQNQALSGRHCSGAAERKRALVDAGFVQFLKELKNLTKDDRNLEVRTRLQTALQQLV